MSKLIIAIDGPAAELRIQGRSDLRAQTHDQRIDVLPKTGMVKVGTQSAARVVPSPARAAALSTKSATSTASTRPSAASAGSISLQTRSV